MNEKLPYDEWRAKHTINLSPKIRTALRELHNIDADEEIEWIMRREYEVYLNEQTNS